MCAGGVGFASRMKARGVVLVVVLLLAAAGGVWWWKTRDTSDTPATSTNVTQSGSGSSKSSSSGASAASDPASDDGVGSIVVTVSSDNGPLADATVRLAPAEGDVITLRTNTTGVARADKLALGPWQIAASAPGYEPAGLSRELAKDEVANLALTLVAGGAKLTGTVTDATGGPVAGARVDAAKLGGTRVGRPTDAVATTTTRADGTYEMSVAIGQLVVGVSSPDYAPQSRHVEVVATGAVADFSLVPGGVIEGIVRDARTKEIVAGARVDARRDGGSGIVFAEAGRYRAQSGADGRFRLIGLRPGAYGLTAREKKRVTGEPVIVGIGVAEQVTDVELLLGSGRVLSGLVVDENDTPIPHVSISLNGDGPGIAEDSNDKGEFAFVGLPPGRYFLLPSEDEWTAGRVEAIELTTKDVTDVRVRLRSRLKVVGHVEPRQQCTISYEPDGAGLGNGQMPVFVVPRPTDADGNFELPVGPAKATLTARCPSGAYGTKDIAPSANTAPIVIDVKGGASIAGRVVDAKGQPVASAAVMAAPAGDERRVTVVNGMVTSGVQTLSNANGEYEIVGLAPGPYAMSALDRGRPLRSRGGKPVKVTLADAEKKTGVDIAIDRPDGVIRGVVTGPDGKPLPDAWVSVQQDLHAMLDAIRDEQALGSSTMTISTSDGDEATDFAPVLTDASGRFEIRDLPHGTFEVIAEAQAGALRGRAANVSPDATLAIQALGLTSLSGTVRSANGPTAVFRVELVGPITAARTFTDGTFQFGRVDPGEYALRVTSSEGNAEVKVTVVANRPTKTDVVLVANAVVTGKVVDGEGNPVAGVGVVLVKDEGEGRTTVSLDAPPPKSADDGTFRVEGPARPSALVLMAPPSPTIKRPLALEAGTTLDLGAIRLEPRRGSGAPPTP